METVEDLMKICLDHDDIPAPESETMLPQHPEITTEEVVQHPPVGRQPQNPGTMESEEGFLRMRLHNMEDARVPSEGIPTREDVTEDESVQHSHETVEVTSPRRPEILSPRHSETVEVTSPRRPEILSTRHSEIVEATSPRRPEILSTRHSEIVEVTSPQRPDTLPRPAGQQYHDPELVRQPQPRNARVWIALAFLIVHGALENLATYGFLRLTRNYMVEGFKMERTEVFKIHPRLYIATGLLSLVGSIIGDSALSQYWVIGAGSLSSLLGIGLMWLTTLFPDSLLPVCTSQHAMCRPAVAWYQKGFMWVSICLVIIGRIFVGPCSLAFATAQLPDARSSTRGKKKLALFYRLWYCISTLCASFASIVFSDVHDWRIQFSLILGSIFIATASFFLGTWFYLTDHVEFDFFTAFFKVGSATIRNWNKNVPDDIRYHHGLDHPADPTPDLKFLNKACIVRSVGDVDTDGRAVHSWRLCTVKQVQTVKLVLRVLPLWSTGLVLPVGVGQGAVPFFQLRSMGRRVGALYNYGIPAAGVLVISAIDQFGGFVLSKLWGQPVQLSSKLRLLSGLVIFSIASMSSAIIEDIRVRHTVFPAAASIVFFLPRFFSSGAQVVTLVTQTLFFYEELSDELASLAVALAGLNITVSSILVPEVEVLVAQITGGGVHHQEILFWIWVVICIIDMFYLFVLSRLYRENNVVAAIP